MRPIRLDLDGFTVFREPTTVDFTDTDFFALVGPTGSGKSTVLDAICFALYGTVPRWGDRRAIANALAPSAAEARVRLVFESAGVRYVLARVVRRDAKGAVTTKHAGLEALPHGFDLGKFDTGLTGDDIGTVLAGTATEVDEAVQTVVGLPYEQFTKCVVLPQGEFAAFLHAKPAERQKILVNLLGLDVYGQIRERATSLGTTAEAKLKILDDQLRALSDIGDDALAAAVARVAALTDLGTAVDRIAPQLADAGRLAGQAADALADLDTQIERLGAVAMPAEAATLAAAASAAREAVTGAVDAARAAEEAEEKLRGELQAAGDATALRRLLDTHASRSELAREAADVRSTVAAAARQHSTSVDALELARTQAADALTALEAAREAYQAAMAVDRAMALRPFLKVGEACPVCEQPVHAVPEAPHDSAVAALRVAGDAARKRSDAAASTAEDRDRAARDADRALAAAKAHAEQVDARLTALDTALDGAPAPDALRRELDAIATLQSGLEKAGLDVRRARDAHRKAAATADRAEEKLRSAWRAFDTARDGLAAFAPPPANRDDLADAWGTLAAWATGEAGRRRAGRQAAVDDLRAAERRVTEVRDELRTLFSDAGLPLPGADPARDAAVALERADAARRRIEEKRKDAERIREQRDEVAKESQVAKALAQHLRADRFERWLLAEALDTLVDGASRTLRELSNGQYDLVHEKGEFFVVDHHDAGLRRAVRTLSGGETFQASLALALALSDQLAGMSTAAASLESIVLDEGFGTLDSSTLDTVAATLENLAARGDRMVGVVTHVGALAERIPVRFEVRRDARTARIERVGL
ncbi:SMC family ATPase [Dactylosporangium sp. AC04546]|uniref:AAA family ATPase n=1 Tax=Dactylosporangium sp. AC04546 TaxID=2862460 RepID=UPI001EE0A05E|nr:SMC family ATPase [Dactylosporangium sp. AC04546]WVK85462.1 SMC family ATPase [Dactylosporangium sp. AC04546]